MMKIYSNLRTLLSQYRLVLASSSPRRVDLLRSNGFTFRQIIPDIDEDKHFHDDPAKYAETLATLKAEAVLEHAQPDEIILGCDTIVIHNGRIIGKPNSPKHAFEMLTSLSGQKHTVCSAITLLLPSNQTATGSEMTDVFFNNVAPHEIDAYIETGEPLDKAGAYGIQEESGFLVDRIEGNIDNVIGLPMTLLDRLAAQLYSELRK